MARRPDTVAAAFESTLIEVWRQCLVEDASTAELGDGSAYCVKEFAVAMTIG